MPSGAEIFVDDVMVSLPASTKRKNGKTKKHMGVANTNVLPMEVLGRMEHTAMLTDVWLSHMDSFVEFSKPK